MSKTTVRPAAIVGVGASAGGLEALEELFRQMPTRTGAAFIVIQHLSRDHESMMDRLLGRVTTMRVRVAEDGLRVEPDNIYVIPPGKELIISAGRLLLTDSPSSETREHRRPIDVFFRSLAQEAEESAVAIVLSGTGSDGASGVCEVHDAGGLVLAQDPATAKFDGMPRAAIDTGTVELMAHPGELPKALSTFFELNAASATTQDHQAAVERILSQLHSDHGVDFTNYKRNMVDRRIERRIAMGGADDVDEYVGLIENSPDERDDLYRDLLIGVTRFYRDPEAFDALAESVLPDLVRQLDEDQELRAWVCACGTGEEAYTVAMLIHEAFRDQGRPPRARIFATDVHQRSLDHAAAGVYSEAALDELPAPLRDRYFDATEGGFRVNAELRKSVVYAKHDAVTDAPFTRVQLITCRNFLIYLKPTAQRKVLSLFLFGLHTRGAIMLGRSENASAFTDELRLIADRARIYRKHREPRTPVLRRHSAKGIPPPPSTTSPGPAPMRRLLRVYDQLLEAHMPPAMLVDDSHNLVHVFGSASKYLQLVSGRPTQDVTKLLRKELRGPVLGLLQRARRDEGRVTLKRTRGIQDGMLALDAQRIDPTSEHGFTIIRFEDVDVPRPDPNVSQEVDVERLSDERFEALEEELQHTRESLQATIEELESSNEEMQTTNEELMASNEELQSTNEELQSVNEELYTVNAELERKIDELSQVTADVELLLRTMEVGTIHVDAELHVKRFTPLAADKFHFESQDVGRHIGDFNTRLELPTLIADLEKVLNEDHRIEREVQDDRGHWYLLRMLPYRQDGKLTGAVITIIDVDALKDAQEAAREAVVRRDEFLAVLSHELRNPLAAILNASEVAEANPEHVSRSMEVVRRQSHHMAGLLRDLLDVSRVTSDKLTIEKEPLDLATVIEGAVETTVVRAESREIELVVSLEEGPIPMLGDPVRLRQVISNLVHNAIKYNQPGGHVWLRVERHDREVVIRVKDDGIGMREDMLETLFEPFVQSRRGAERAEGGMGLGLALVQGIVHGHDGSVRAHSSGPGMGSELVARLPLSPDLELTPRVDAAAIEETSSSRLLLVEDDPDAREMMVVLLTKLGYEVHAAEDVNSALDAYARALPAAVITDIGLPGESGLVLARKLRAKAGASLAIIAMSGYGRPGDKAAASKAGVDEHLVKPVTIERLRRTLSALLRQDTNTTV